VIARHYRPAAPLSHFVDLFWYYAGHVREHSKERLLPTGTLELVINLHEDEVRTYDPDNTDICHRLPGSVVVGVHSRYFVLDTSEQNDVIGIHFKPGGAFPFLAPPMDEFRNAHVALDAVWGSGVGVLPRGKRVGVTPLLYGLLLPSGNDAARVLAQNVGGTIPRFVRLMNERARQLGLTCTHFAGPDGYSDANRSCPRDLAEKTAG